MENFKLPHWNEIWNGLDQNNQQEAASAFTTWLRSRRSEKKGNYYKVFLRQLSKKMHFRAQSVEKMSEKRIASSIRRYVNELFDDDDWRILFTEHYMNNKCEIMCRFLDLCGINHDKRGGINEEFEAPENFEGTPDKLIEEFGHTEVTTYFSVLVLHDPDTWKFVLQSLHELISQQELQKQEIAPPFDDEIETDQSPALDMSEDFTQLDRILIDQVLAAVADEERALSKDEVIDLVDTVHALDTSRKRTYFHLGFIDTLLPDQEVNFNRPEFNDDRRGWYMAGLLTGASRRRNSELMRVLLKENDTYFSNAISRPGGAGATMMRSIYPYLLDAGLLSEAISLLRAQAGAANAPSIEITLNQATRLLRSGDTTSASSLLGALCEALRSMSLDDTYRKSFKARINRRRGQAMQMQGNFDAAKKLFKGLLVGQGSHTAGLLADMGMVAGGFRQLSEIRVPVSVDRRQVIHDSLNEGIHYYQEAAEKFSSNAPNAQYALSVHAYLECMDPDKNEDCTESLRSKALEYVNNALTGMTSSESLSAYEELGIIGHARFIQSVLLMGSLEASQTRKAMSAWREISKEAGKLPSWDVQALIESAELIDSEYAIEIGESIWEYRQDDALDIITSSNLITESDTLRGELLSMAQQESGTAEEIWSRWTLLIPALLKKNEIDKAEDGLDRLEDLAINGRYAEKMIEWLQLSENYDPAWSEEDVYRARFRLLRRLGRDTDAFEQLRQLFFLLRDQNPEEANQIYTLFKDYRADEDLYTDLILQKTEQDDAVIEPNLKERLSDGEQVNVLFIGGNEIQARYDGALEESLKSEWPGITVKFEHTGWSSNWGREVSRLKNLAAESDAVVLMTMMRTKLGRTMRSALNDPPRPWISCTGTGKQAMKNSIRKAAMVGLQQSSAE